MAMASLALAAAQEIQSTCSDIAATNIFLPSTVNPIEEEKMHIKAITLLGGSCLFLPQLHPYLTR